jgi:prepilin-type N-terminal cleavage/methylation domain-containing protein
MEMKLPLRGEKGFSLVEITVALVIGSIGLLALAGIIVYTTNANRYATDISIATALARQRMEQVKLLEYNDLHRSFLTEASLGPNGNLITGGRYTRVTEVRENEAGFNTKTVIVTVYFSPAMEDTLKKALVSTIIYP